LTTAGDIFYRRQWNGSCLECRIVRPMLGIEQITIRTTRGCLQRGVLPPLLWFLVIDKLTDLDSQVFLDLKTSS
jgi:hypothetical protein